MSRPVHSRTMPGVSYSETQARVVLPQPLALTRLAQAPEPAPRAKRDPLAVSLALAAVCAAIRVDGRHVNPPAPLAPPASVRRGIAQARRAGVFRDNPGMVAEPAPPVVVRTQAPPLPDTLEGLRAAAIAKREAMDARREARGGNVPPISTNPRLTRQAPLAPPVTWQPFRLVEPSPAARALAARLDEERDARGMLETARAARQQEAMMAHNARLEREAYEGRLRRMAPHPARAVCTQEPRQDGQAYQAWLQRMEPHSARTNGEWDRQVARDMAYIEALAYQAWLRRMKLHSARA